MTRPADSETVRLVAVEDTERTEPELREQIARAKASRNEFAERALLRVIDNPAWIGDVHATRLAVVALEQFRNVRVLEAALAVEFGASPGVNA